MLWEILWNAREPLVSSELPVFNLYKVLSNFYEFWVSRFSWQLYSILQDEFISVCLFRLFMFYDQHCVIPHEVSALFIMYQNGIHNLFSKLIETNFDQKLPWHFSNNIWTTFVVQCNSMELKQHKLKLHGNLAWSKVPWNFFHTPEFHGIPCNY